MAKVVMTCPDFDIATKSCSPYFTKYVAEAAGAEGWTVVLLYGGDAVKSKFEAACLDPDVVMITGIGHGSETVFTGQNQEILLERCSYDVNIVKGKDVTHLSCSTGAPDGLLEDAVAKGARGAQGYSDVYYFFRNTRIEDPLQDPMCDSFIGSDVLRHIGRIQGKSFEDATGDARTRYEEKARYWDQVDPEVAELLRYDARIMVIYTEVTPPPKEYCWLPGWLRRLLGCPY